MIRTLLTGELRALHRLAPSTAAGVDRAGRPSSGRPEAGVVTCGQGRRLEGRGGIDYECLAEVGTPGAEVEELPRQRGPARGAHFADDWSGRNPGCSRSSKAASVVASGAHLRRGTTEAARLGAVRVRPGKGRPSSSSVAELAGTNGCEAHVRKNLAGLGGEIVVVGLTALAGARTRLLFQASPSRRASLL